MKEINQSDLPLGSGGTQSKGKGNNQTSTQEREIYLLLFKNPSRKFTKYEVKKELELKGKINSNVPESSISRGLSNLCHKEGKIAKLREYRLGGLGRKNRLWKIVETIPVGTQTDLFKP